MASKMALSELCISDFKGGLIWAIANPGCSMASGKLVAALKLPKPVAIAVQVFAKLFVIGQFAKRSPLGFPNPTLRVGEFMLGKYSLGQLLVCLSATVGGAIAGTHILKAILKALKQDKLAESIKPPAPKEGLTKNQVVGIEALVATGYLFCVLRLLRGGSPRAGLVGLLSIMIGGSKFTGPGLDPASVIANSVVAQRFTHLNQYLAGSSIGAVAGGILVKAIANEAPVTQ